jgi:putative permease
MRVGPQELEVAIFRALRKAISLVVGLYLLFQFLGAVSFVVLFFGLVLLLAAVLNPVVVWLQRRRIPRPLGAVALGLLLAAMWVGVIWLVIPPLIDQGQQLIDRAPQLWNDLRPRIERFLAQHPDLARQVPTTDELLRRLQPVIGRLAPQLGRYTLAAFGALLSSVLMLVLVVYSLASPQPLVAGFLAAVPERHRPKAQRILELILARLKAWAMGSLLLGVIVGVMTGVGLYLLKVPFALVFGVVAGFGELLPNVGPLLSSVPPLLVALAIDPTLALWVVLLFLAVQQLENNLIVPLVMSRKLDLHPLSITFIVLVMGVLFGIVGAILAVPTAVIVKTLYQELYLNVHVSDPEALEAQSERVLSDAAAHDESTVSRSADRRENATAA